jgi:predicted ATPase
MIKQIDLQGFKSFVLDTLYLGNLTLLTGLNSSGKSSIIQSLLLTEKVLKNEDFYLDGHGSIHELQNPYEKGIGITTTFADESAISIQNGKGSITGTPVFPTLIYISADRFGPETSVSINASDNKLGSKGQNIFKCIDYYSDQEIPMILRHEKSEGDTFLFNLRAWLGVISPNVKFEHKIQTMSDSSYGTFNDHRAKNVGFGLSYTLPVITALLLGAITPNSLVIIENPEAHLHPRGQTAMAKLISLCVEAGSQVIIETHSDHLFDGIRIHVKESQENFHEKVAIYWFELDSKNNTEVHEVQLDKNGRIEQWPAGMFDQFEINASKLL